MKISSLNSFKENELKREQIKNILGGGGEKFIAPMVDENGNPVSNSGNGDTGTDDNDLPVGEPNS